MNKVELICIVDDKDDLRFILQKMFKISFPTCSILLFEHGQSLLDELSHMNQFPSLILMDRHMPILDGYQTLLKLKQDYNYQLIPVVMMSAEANLAEIRDCYRAGANSFLRKPISFQEQLERITQIGQYWLQANLSSQ